MPFPCDFAYHLHCWTEWERDPTWLRPTEVRECRRCHKVERRMIVIAHSVEELMITGVAPFIYAEER